MNKVKPFFGIKIGATEKRADTSKILDKEIYCHVLKAN